MLPWGISVGREGPDGARAGREACSHRGTQRWTPRLEVSPTHPVGPPVCPCASVLGAWGLLAQLSSIEILSLAPLRLPSPPPGVTLPPMLFWNLGSCVKVAGRGFRDAVRAGAGAGASLPALAGFNPSCWAAVPGALGSKGPGNERHVSSQQLGGALGPDDISRGRGRSRGEGLCGAGTGVDTATEVYHGQGASTPGRGSL